MIPRVLAWLKEVREPFDVEVEEDVPTEVTEPATAVEGHPVWGEVYPELRPHEFRAPEKMCPDFLRIAVRIRRESGVPFRIVSSWRDPATNPGAANSAHTDVPCKALDLRVLDNWERFRLVETAIRLGISRLGIYPPNEHQRRAYGKGSGSVHIDASETRPSPRIWMSW